MHNYSIIKVFLDTNILIEILDNSNYLANLEGFDSLQKQYNVKFYTFEKCMYEYFNGYKKKLLNNNFLIKFLNDELVIDNGIKERTKNIISQSAYSRYYTTTDLINAIKVYSDVKGRKQWVYAMTQHYQNEDEEIEKMKALIKDFDEKHLDNDTILRYFYHRINANFCKFRYSFEDALYKQITPILYEQVFDIVNTSQYLRGLVEHSLINPHDLESVVAALSSHCSLFLTNDENLVTESISLGDNHITKFMRIQIDRNNSPVNLIKVVMEKYLLSHGLI